MLKIITIINWIAIGVLAVLVGAETLFPAKGGDAAGRGMGMAIYYLAIIALIALLILNLLPYNWTKYTAFGLILLPFVFIKLDPVWIAVKQWSSRRPEGLNADGTPWFQDKNNGLLEFAVGEATYTTYKPDEKVACVRLLFDAGARITPDSQENSILVSPATTGRAQLVKLLLEHGADPNTRDIYYRKPVLFEAIASYQQPNETVQVLLDAGADPNAIYTEPGNPPFSALQHAAANGRWYICLLLLEKGADRHASNSGAKALHSLLDEADPYFRGDGYSTRADFDQLKKAVE
ncbi:MAG: ankyrin repeat domain-containing protein [Saprospirales bacterium]|nr:ankyrin repeat domain-containing protein [Saprospirales bacterium]